MSILLDFVVSMFASFMGNLLTLSNDNYSDGNLYEQSRTWEGNLLAQQVRCE